MHRTTLGTLARPRISHPAVLSPLAILKAIVLETMDCPPVRPFSADSYLPPHLLDAAQHAIAAAEGRHVAGRAAA